MFMSQKEKMLPSGKSVQQAKKDAKRRANEKGIPLSLALNDIAQKHGHAAWNDLMCHIDKLGPVLGSLKVPLASPQNRKMPIYLSSPIICLVGQSGAGKSVTAMNFAEQWINQNKSVYLLGYNVVSMPWIEDYAHMVSLDLISRYKDRFSCVSIESPSKPWKDEDYLNKRKSIQSVARLIDPPKGAMVIIDEASLLYEKDTIDVLAKWAKEKQIVICLLLQSPDEMVLGTCKKEDMDTIGAFIIGYLRTYSTLKSFLPVFQKATSTIEALRVKKDEYAEMLVVTKHPNWSGVARIPKPAINSKASSL